MSCQLPKTSLWIKQKPYKREKQQKITCISYRNAVNIPTKRKPAASTVLIERRLIKTPTLIHGDTIHRNTIRRDISRKRPNIDLRNKIGRSMCTRIIIDGKTSQCNRKRQTCFFLFSSQIIRCRNSLFQVYHAVTSRKPCQQCSQ